MAPNSSARPPAADLGSISGAATAVGVTLTARCSSLSPRGLAICRIAPAERCDHSSLLPRNMPPPAQSNRRSEESSRSRPPTPAPASPGTYRYLGDSDSARTVSDATASPKARNPNMAFFISIIPRAALTELNRILGCSPRRGMARTPPINRKFRPNCCRNMPTALIAILLAPAAQDTYLPRRTFQGGLARRPSMPSFRGANAPTLRAQGVASPRDSIRCQSVAAIPP
jgi:hypothetical protein